MQDFTYSISKAEPVKTSGIDLVSSLFLGKAKGKTVNGFLDLGTEKYDIVA